MPDETNWTLPVKASIGLAALCLLSSFFGNYLSWRQLRVASESLSPSARPGTAVTPQDSPRKEFIASPLPLILTSVSSVMLFGLLALMARSYTKLHSEHAAMRVSLEKRIDDIDERVRKRCDYSDGQRGLLVNASRRAFCRGGEFFGRMHALTYETRSLAREFRDLMRRFPESEVTLHPFGRNWTLLVGMEIPSEAVRLGILWRNRLDAHQRCAMEYVDPLPRQLFKPDSSGDLCLHDLETLLNAITQYRDSQATLIAKDEFPDAMAAVALTSYHLDRASN